MSNTIINGETYNIHDTTSLAQTIENVQAKVKVREAALKEKLSKLPKEGLKSATSMVVPAFLTTKLASASISTAWNLTKLAIGKKKAVFPLVRSIAKAGLFFFIKKKSAAASGTK
ncbi:MAG: hypothetical protein ABIN67_08890 [Ferruginibacter sp.]